LIARQTICTQIVWISEGNKSIIAAGDPDLFNKSGGRLKVAPTDSIDRQLDKLEIYRACLLLYAVG